MDNSFWLLLVFIFAFWLGKQWAYTSIAYKFFRLAKQHGINLDEVDETKKSSSAVSNCNLEVHGECMYLFEKETNTFLCQGQTLEELASKLEKYQGITQAKVTYNDKNLYLVNGQFTKEA